MEIVTGDMLDYSGLKRLSEIYARMWNPVLRNEYRGYSPGELLDEVTKQFESRINMFPEGQLSVWNPKDGVMGGVSAIMVSAKDENGKTDYNKVPGKWNELTSDGFILNHDYNGNLLMCYSINVDPNHSGKGVAKMLLNGGRDFAKENGLIACPYTRPVGLRAYLENNGFDENFDHKSIGNDELDYHLHRYLFGKAADGRHPDKNIGMHSHFGASIKRILPESRNTDIDSCGYCIIMAYPE